MRTTAGLRVTDTSTNQGRPGPEQIPPHGLRGGQTRRGLRSPVPGAARQCLLRKPRHGARGHSNTRNKHTGHVHSSGLGWGLHTGEGKNQNQALESGRVCSDHSSPPRQRSRTGVREPLATQSPTCWCPAWPIADETRCQEGPQL